MLSLRRAETWDRTIRTAHKWAGLVLAPLLAALALTGIALNHKPLLHRWFGGPPAETGSGPSAATGGGATKARTVGMPDACIGVEAALCLAADRLGKEATLDKIELREDQGRWVYKVHTREKEQVAVDARDGGIVAVKLRPAGAGGKAPIEVDKWLKDIHTGKAMGTAGTALVDVAGAGCLLLGATGVYLAAVRRRCGRCNNHK